MVDILQKKLVVFDLDGTLTESKVVIDEEMTTLLRDLLAFLPVAIIGGGSYEQFQKQFVVAFPANDAHAGNLFLFPTCSTQFYRNVRGTWTQVYAEFLPEDQKQKIRDAFAEAFREINYQAPEKTYGDIIEDRKTQLTFSVFGQDVVAVLGDEGLRLKDAYFKEHDDVRRNLRDAVARLLPDFEVRLGGLTSVDVTRKGIDKGYGIRQIEKILKISIANMVFVGDALYEGGNDAPARDAGADSIQANGPTETKKLVRQWLDKLK